MNIGDPEPDTSPTDLIDAIWLASAGYSHRPQPPGDTPADAGSRPALASVTRTPSAARPPVESHPGLRVPHGRPAPDTAEPRVYPVPPAPLARDATRAADVSLLPPHLVPPESRDPRTEIELPRPRALKDAYRIARALRPLRGFGGPDADLVLDEEATAARSAEAKTVLPQFRQQGRRTARLTILVCDGPTMRWWRSGVDELIEALPLSGAFRSVRVWRLGEDSPVRLRPWNGDRAQDRDLATIVDHTGRQVTLLITDGQGPARRAAEIREMLTGLAALGPTAVLQVLPTHLWHLTWMRQTSATVSVVRGLATVAAEPGRRTPVVPILRLEPGWLASWARLTGGTEAHGVALTVLGPPGPREPDSDLAAPGGEPGWVQDVDDAAQQVQRFRAVASLTAYRLACHLAVAPLTLPVMQLVQAYAVPESGPDHLAEVGVSGLLVRQDEPRDDEDPAGVVYEFAAGVRRELLGSMPRSQIDAVVRILGKLPRSATDPLGGRLNLPAIADELASGDGEAIDPRRLPWARVATTVLRALGGSNRAVAEQIERNIAEAGGHRPSGPTGTGGGRQDLPVHLGAFLRVLRAVADPWSQPGGAGSHGRLRGPLDEIAPLAAWLAAPTVEDRLRVLAGPAGSGKSTVVAAALAAVHPLLRDEPLPGPLRAQLPVHEPAQTRILAVDAAFLSCDEVRAALAGQAGAAGEDLPVVLDRFGSACTVVLDGAALATDPRGLLELVVAPILRNMACRVLLVTTPTAALDDFLDTVREARGTVPVRLPAADRELLRERLLDVLATHPEFGRAGLQDARRALAAAGAEHLDGLAAATGIGGLLAAGVIAADAAAQGGTEPVSQARVAQLAAGHLPLLFETQPVLQGRPDLRLVFVVAAFARGGGMPLAVLRMCARRIRPGGAAGPDDEPPLDDVQHALKALRYFLGVEQRADAEYYSPAHPTLTRHLRSRPYGQAELAHQRAVLDIERAIADTLLAAARAAEVQAEVAAYLAENLAGHAFAAGLFDEFLMDLPLVAAADPDHLRPLLGLARDPGARRVANVYSAAGVAAHTGDERLDQLVYAIVRAGLDAPPLPAPAPDSWRAVWAAPAMLPLRPVGPRIETERIRSLAGVLHDDTLRVVCAGPSGSVRIYDADTGQALRTLATSGPGRSVTWTASAEGPLLVQIERATVHVADRELRAGPDNLRCVAGGANGLVVTGDKSGRVALWNAPAGQLLWRVEHSPGSWVTAVALVDEPGGDPWVVAASDDGRIRLFDATGTAAAGPAQLDGGVVALAAAIGDDTVVVAAASARGGPAWLWRHGLDEPSNRLAGGDVTSVAFIADGSHVVTGAADGLVCLWFARTAALVREEAQHTAAVRALSTGSGPGRHWLLTGDDRGIVQQWRLRPWDADASVALAAVPGPNPWILVAGVDEDPEHIELADGRVTTVLRGDAPVVAAAAGSAVLVTATAAGTVTVWDPATVTPRRTVPVPGPPTCLACAGTTTRAMIVTGHDDGTVRVVAPDGRQRTLTVGRGPIEAVVITASGAIVACSGQTCAVVDPDPGQPVRTAELSLLRSVTAAAVSPADPDGEVFLCADDGTVYRLGLDALTLTGELTGSAGIRQLAALDTVVAGIETGTDETGEGALLHAWHPPSGRPLARFRLPGDIRAIAAAGDDLVVWHGRELTRLRWVAANP
ncbi:SAV_2336 N-terminal domain-related protein [Dactylosporangium sp. NPDC000521]|uniref:SAV_2336 N-terminal domain-related protein n=1 Tax=Dactylosporangium sp. NPDC000521 TaxID=3363975 RepID=UPI0036A1B0AD